MIHYSTKEHCFLYRRPTPFPTTETRMENDLALFSTLLLAQI